MPVGKSWLTSVALVAVVGSACHSKPPTVTAPPPVPVREAPAPVPPPPPPPRPQPAPTPTPATLSEEEIFRRTTLDELNAESPLGDAFFALDQSDLTDQARATLQRDATWLVKWKTTAITIEGHCDDRGTAEYNLALGQRRAAAIRAYLGDLGVEPRRIVTMSLGKEQPFCRASGESCWAQNRRGHFVITAK